MPHARAVQKGPADDAEVVDGEAAGLDRPRHIKACKICLMQ